DHRLRPLALPRTRVPPRILHAAAAPPTAWTLPPRPAASGTSLSPAARPTMAVRAPFARCPHRPRSRLRERLHTCSRPPDADRGAAAVEYTAVAVLVCTLAVAILGAT